VVCDAGNDRAQIGFWIQPVEFRGFNDGVHRGGPHCETITQPWPTVLTLEAFAGAERRPAKLQVGET
jgi:hypothetical protein